MEDLQSYYTMVEEIIQELGVDPVTTRGDEPGQWSLVKGSLTVWIDIQHREKEGRAYYQVMGPIIQVPASNREAFYQELLEINHQLYGVGFVKFKDWIYLKVIREVAGMDKEEARAMLQRIGTYGDEYDDVLKNKYGSNSGPGGR